MFPDYTISEFYGQATAVKDLKTLKPGFSPDALNWITTKEKDAIELRRGYARLGATEVTGNGRVTGLGVSTRYDGTQVVHYSYGRKVKYYDTTTADMVEVGTDLLPAAADGEDVWMRQYQGLAGSFAYIGSPNSSVYKIPAANPGSARDQLVSSYRWGVFHVGRGRAFAGQRNGTFPGNQDKTGFYLSYVDNDQLSDFTAVTGESGGTGDGSDKTFNGTLAEITGVRTAMYPVISAPVGSAVNVSTITRQQNAYVETSASHGLAVGDFVRFTSVGGMTEVNGKTYNVVEVISATEFRIGFDTSSFTAYTSGGTVSKVERFVDDRNGNLISNLSGTGTINYATGAWEVTFNTAPQNSGSILIDYYWENATSAGILDFTGSSNGQGKSFRQDDGGGALMAVFNINNTQYPLHQLKTWEFKFSLDDTQSTNLPYRNIGIPYTRAAYQTPDGILLADLSRPTDPKFRKMQVLQGTNIETIEPKSISDILDLSPFAFDRCVAFRWGDYEIFCVQEKVNEVANAFNSIMWVHNVVSGTWDKLRYYVSCLEEYNGTLISGDSISNNVYTLFSGFDEDGDVIENYWTSSDLNLGSDNLKNCRRMVLNGLIQPDQQIKVSLAYDGGDFSEVFTVDGRGSYVDSGVNTYIGGPTVGAKVIGGGGSITANPFEVDFKINSDRFIHVRVKIEALGIGYAAINEMTFKDIRDKGRKNLPVRTQ